MSNKNDNLAFQELNVFSLSERVISSLDLIYYGDNSVEATSGSSKLKEAVPQKPLSKNAENDGLGSSECKVCKLSFNNTSTEEKREHYKTDLHRFNLKRNLAQMEPVSEAEFDRLVENSSIDSISGSDSRSDEEDEDSEDEDNKFDSILKKIDEIPLNDGENQEEYSSVSHLYTRSPFIFFKSELLPLEKVFAVYKALYSEKELRAYAKSALQKWSQAPIKEGKSALLMLGGGHFAGAIVSHEPKDISKDLRNYSESKEEQAVNIIESKTFHRYTTRRKQGGSQSASDNASGKANSAGSSLRRHNHQMLINDVRSLLASWRNQLNDCDKIFIRAAGSSTRNILVGYDNCVIRKDDPRIKHFPFTTKRATKSELKRAWSQLSYLHIMDKPKPNLKQQERIDKEQEVLQNSLKQKEKINNVPEITEEEKHSGALVSFLKKSKAPLLINYIRKNNISPDIRLEPRENYLHYPTMLHYASSQGLSHMVYTLLATLKADPIISNEFGKTPSELSANSQTKKAFQIARYSLGEDFCDWTKAKIGGPKTREQVLEEELETKKQEERERQRIMEQELSRKTELEMKEPSYRSSGTLGGKGALNAAVDFNGLSDQQKMRIMREQRARAAEERIRRMKK